MGGKSDSMKKAEEFKKRLETSKNEIIIISSKLLESANLIKDFDKHSKANMKEAIASVKECYDNLRAEYEQFGHLVDAYKDAMNNWMQGK